MSLAAFVEHTGRTLEQIYDAEGMTHLRRLAGQLPLADDKATNRRFARLLHIDDPARLAVLRNPAAAESLQQLMLGYQLFHEAADLFEPADWLPRLIPELLAELGELAGALGPRAHALESPHRPRVAAPPPPALRPAGSPDRLWPHDAAATAQPPRGRAAPHRHADGAVLRDARQVRGRLLADHELSRLPISRDHFHWETQNAAAEDTPTGRRYIEQHENGWRFLLFVRETRDDAFVALGPVRYVSHTGERPMGITWKLETPLSAALFERFAALLVVPDLK